MSRDGNTIAVGFHLEDSGAKGINGDQSDASAEDSGAVYVYTRTGTSWNPAAYVKASNTTPASEFGIAVALSGDGKVLAVGAGEASAAEGGEWQSKGRNRPRIPARLTFTTEHASRPITALVGPEFRAYTRAVD